MIKKLILCRHAQAEAPVAGQTDFSRALTPNGQQQASQVAQQLVQAGFLPDLALCSAAPRARETARLICAALNLPGPKPLEQLYEASPKTLLMHVNQLPPQANTVLLVAHNPGLSNFATLLSGRYYNLEPASWVCLELAVEDWTLVSAGTGF